MDDRLTRFLHNLYFDVQRIDGVSSLEIWNGVREFDDPIEKTSLIKNLYKIVVPLVNEELFARPFSEHSRSAKTAVSGLLDRLTKNAGPLVLDRFPDPPVGDSDQKELYRRIKAEALVLVKDAAGKVPAKVKGALYPDGLFDFRELRVVDNELPYIIFTDKEFRVIHGLVVVYLWLIDLDLLFLQTLEDNGVGREMIEEYRRFAGKVLKENPLLVAGRKMEPRELFSRLGEKLKYEDYLDVFENVYYWRESARTRFSPKE